ncbi:hypothetical protein BG53_12730 [Paenibacillus darwinianus]|uniref:Uncharacterized protein n=1 Tax=Paenibacillus darwinianus TaxID=1380763 RepID=A0A9W5S238_9BACL|nr:hypothetical protein [Paenibacillus darwinianus]EXX86066.1 hypothetical protein CH50_07950 [Paenibacillus darwinianus]EXX86375.1 hypothetical protein BG52_06650 [Paenibacillus darwinianus]EXX90878.1 hypothetical protein BG53_12730 [Paenibacillus darwinianus]
MKSLLIFILFATTLCWLMFSPIYKHVLIVRQAVLEKEVDYLLEVGANGDHGYIDAEMTASSRLRLASYGLRPEAVEYVAASTTGAPADNPAAPLLRGTGLELTIRYPYEGLLNIDRLIGLTLPDDSARISAYGMKMSEYVP